MLQKIDAKYFDGKTSKKQSVSIEFFKNRSVKVKGDGVVFVESFDNLAISSRVANTPRMITFADESIAYSSSNDAIDSVVKELNNTRSIAYLLESKMRYALLFVVLLVLSVIFFLTTGSDLIAKSIAKITPQILREEISTQTLEMMDEYLLEPSLLSVEQKDRFQTLFSELTNQEAGFHLHFRRGIGPNAFALPSGDIVLMDELVELSDGEDKMIYGVLAHEVGHVKHKHSMQLIVKVSIVNIIIAYFTGDISSTVASVGTTMLHANYSREFESQADHYAKIQMIKAGIEPKYLAEFFVKIETNSSEDQSYHYFDSHPSNQERIDALLAPIERRL